MPFIDEGVIRRIMHTVLARPPSGEVGSSLQRFIVWVTASAVFCLQSYTLNLSPKPLNPKAQTLNPRAVAEGQPMITLRV